MAFDKPGTLTRIFLLPHLSVFLSKYPNIRLQLGQTERLVDLVREGVDCVIRAGTPEDSSMIMRLLVSLPEITCASPEYIAQYGHPNSVEDIEGHRLVGFLSSRSGTAMLLEFKVGKCFEEVPLPAM